MLDTNVERHAKAAIPALGPAFKRIEDEAAEFSERLAKRAASVVDPLPHCSGQYIGPVSEYVQKQNEAMRQTIERAQI